MSFILNFYIWFIHILYILSGRIFSTIVVVVLLFFLMLGRRPMVGCLLLIFIHPLSVAIHETFPEKLLQQFIGKGVEQGP
jgi:hypothetical protein